MVKIVVEDGTCSHTGSVCAGAVAGTLSLTTQSFVTISGLLIMVDPDDRMEVPGHLGPTCLPPPESHSYPVDTFQQSFVTIDGIPIVLLGDSYSSDTTVIDFEGGNLFVDITP